jgi:hypothetical protein
MDYVCGLADALRAWRIELLLPAFDGPEQELRLFHKQNIKDCHAVAVCWVNGSETWARVQASELKDWQGLGREHQFVYRSVVAGPPSTKEKSPKWLAQIFPRTRIEHILDLVAKATPAPEDVRDLAPSARADPR